MGGAQGVGQQTADAGRGVVVHVQFAHGTREGHVGHVEVVGGLQRGVGSVGGVPWRACLGPYAAEGHGEHGRAVGRVAEGYAVHGHPHVLAAGFYLPVGKRDVHTVPFEAFGFVHGHDGNGVERGGGPHGEAR